MKKKTEAMDANAMVRVDLGKLSAGLAHTFQGVTEVFESLGADAVPGFGTVSAVEGEKADEAAADPTEDKTAKKPAKKEEKATEDTAESPQTTAEAVETTEADNTEARAEPSSEEPEKTAEGKQAGEDKPEAGTSPFTLNDIMKIAAQKMAKDTGVTEKIGALVKTYGVSTLKELPEEKFEAFMTDLTQI